MPEFKYDWFSGNIPALTRLLERFKGNEDLHALEIGCFEGRSTVWFLENILTAGTSSMTCVDNFKQSADHAHFNVDVSGVEKRFWDNVSNWSHRVTMAKGDSWAVLRSLKGAFDFLYIDGSHLAADVLEDAVLAWRLVKPSGIIIFDDYLWNNMPSPLDNPGPGIDAFLSVYLGKYKLLHKGYQVVIEKL